MARKRRRSSADTPDVASFEEAARPSVTPSIRFETPLQEIEDRRTFHPSGVHRPIRMISTAAPSTLTLRDRKYSKTAAKFGRQWRSPLFRGLGAKLSSQTKASLAHEMPERVIACVRRKQRKEVLHAQRKTGRSGRITRRRRRNETSKYRC